MQVCACMHTCVHTCAYMHIINNIISCYNFIIKGQNVTLKSPVSTNMHVNPDFPIAGIFVPSSTLLPCLGMWGAQPSSGLESPRYLLFLPSVRLEGESPPGSSCQSVWNSHILSEAVPSRILDVTSSPTMYLPTPLTSAD